MNCESVALIKTFENFSLKFLSLSSVIFCYLLCLFPAFYWLEHLFPCVSWWSGRALKPRLISVGKGLTPRNFLPFRIVYMLHYLRSSLSRPLSPLLYMPVF